MFKILILSGLFYMAYRLIFPSKNDNNDPELLNHKDDGEFTDYEEIE
jgi:hypothetical protein